ncbi:hypothetical protein LXL04_023572 [Taraxacum kok-saghyz]
MLRSRARFEQKRGLSSEHLRLWMFKRLLLSPLSLSQLSPCIISITPKESMMMAAISGDFLLLIFIILSSLLRPGLDQLRRPGIVRSSSPIHPNHIALDNTAEAGCWVRSQVRVSPTTCLRGIVQGDMVGVYWAARPYDAGPSEQTLMIGLVKSKGLWKNHKSCHVVMLKKARVLCRKLESSLGKVYNIKKPHERLPSVGFLVSTFSGDSVCPIFIHKFNFTGFIEAKEAGCTMRLADEENENDDIRQFDVDKNKDIDLQSVGHREVHEEYSIVVEDEDLHARDFLNPDQKFAFDEIMRHVEENIPGVFFIDGSGGTGKTFLYKALLANIRSRGLIALATATSGVAANNMSGGRTAHSRFKIPLNLDNNSMCNIKKQSGTAQLLRDAKVIIWDEASMAKRQAVEALDRTMQDITDTNLLFGGKIMVMGGDFRQVLPVVKRGTRAQIVDSSLRMSPLWSSIKRLRLTLNMRAVTDPWFYDFLLRVGDGDEETIDDNFIRIPDDMAIPYTDKAKSMDALFDAIFPSLQSNGSDSNFIISRAILSTKNECVDEINDHLIERFSGEEKVYYSFYEVEDDKYNLYPTKFLNSLTVSGMPPHYLRLKLGCPQNVIDAEIAVGQHAGKRVFLPRIPLCPSDDEMFPFKLKRKQFPVRLSFSMTINKAQGQTIPNVGVYLPESVFSHGQLYVALSRGISRVNTNVLVNPTKTFTHDGVYTSNVVFKEVFCDE